MTIGPSEDTYPGGVYGQTAGQAPPSNAGLSPVMSGPRVVELETFYRTARRYLNTYMLEGADCTTLSDLREAAWCVEHQQSLPGSPGTPLSMEEYEELKAQAHAALRATEIEEAMEALLECVRDEDTDPSYEERTAKILWEVVITTAVSVAAWERGRQLPSMEQQAVDTSVETASPPVVSEDEVIQDEVVQAEVVQDSIPDTEIPPSTELGFWPDADTVAANDIPIESELSLPPEPETETETETAPAPAPSALRSRWKRVRSE